MISTTPLPEYESLAAPAIYAPMDPKYFYRYSGVSPAPPMEKYASGIQQDGTGFAGIEDLMSQRMDLVESRIDLLTIEIDRRYRLKNDNLYRICLDQCTCRDLISHMGERYLDKRRIELEGKIIDLEQEKRREKANHFRDVLLLQKELRESMIEKIEEEQKTNLFK